MISLCNICNTVQNKTFGVYNDRMFLKKTLIKVCSPHIYTSFGTFCVQIGQLFEAQYVFEKCFNIDKYLVSNENVVEFGILPNV